MNKRRAVVIAGDTRTWEHSIHSAHELLDGADVYISVWSNSSYSHKVKPRLLYRHAPIYIDRVYALLAQYNVRGVRIENHDLSHWQPKGYNANYLHRLRVGIDLVRLSGIEYDSVFFMRPDVFYEQHGMQTLVAAVANVQPGQFVTMLSGDQRVNTHKTLNDWMFAVAPTDFDLAVPTVEEFQAHKHEDWHTFLRWWVVERSGLQVVNVDAPRVVILRPQARSGMSFDDALHNSEAWDDLYVLHCINLEGIRTACIRWGKHAVIRAVQNLTL
jgi:hypothetical protein